MTVAPYRTVEEVAARQVRASIVKVMFNYWPAIILIALALRIGIAVVNEFNASVWSAAVSLSPIYLAVIGAIAGGVVMARYIAQGITRRHFATGAMAMIVSCALIAGVITMIGYGVEEVVFSLAGIHHVLAEPSVFESASRALGVFASYVLLNAVYMCCGWTAGVGFYRWGWGGGALFLPVAVLPVMLVEWLVGSDWAWNPTTIVGPARVYMSLPGRIAGDIEISVLVAVLISTLAVGLGLLINRLVMRDVTIS